MQVRREKISERMKYLQDLVPGCDKITGKAGMLDEIINYVQSLQKQVEVKKKIGYKIIRIHKHSLLVLLFYFQRFNYIYVLMIATVLVYETSYCQSKPGPQHR